MVCCITYMTSILYWLNQSNLFSLLILMGGQDIGKSDCPDSLLHAIIYNFMASTLSFTLSMAGWSFVEEKGDVILMGQYRDQCFVGKRLISGSMTATKKGTQSEVLEVENGEDRTEQFSLCCEYSGRRSKWPATPWLNFGNRQYAYVHIQVRSKLLWPLLGNMKCAPVSLAVKKGK